MVPFLLPSFFFVEASLLCDPQQRGSIALAKRSPLMAICPSAVGDNAVGDNAATGGEGGGDHPLSGLYFIRGAPFRRWVASATVKIVL